MRLIGHLQGVSEGTRKELNLASLSSYQNLKHAILKEFSIEEFDGLHYSDKDQENVSIIDDHDVEMCVGECKEYSIEELVIFIRPSRQNPIVAPLASKPQEVTKKNGEESLESKRIKEEKALSKEKEKERLQRVFQPLYKIVSGIINPFRFTVKLDECKDLDFYSKVSDKASELFEECPGLRYNNEMMNKVFDDCHTQIFDAIKQSYNKIAEQNQDSMKNQIQKSDLNTKIYEEYDSKTVEDVQKLVIHEMKIENMKKSILSKQKQNEKLEREKKRSEEKIRKELEKEDKMKAREDRNKLKEEEREIKKIEKEEKIKKRQVENNLKAEEKESKRIQQEEKARLREIEKAAKDLEKKESDLKKKLKNEEKGKMEPRITQKKIPEKEEKDSKTKVNQLIEQNPTSNLGFVKKVACEYVNLSDEDLDSKVKESKQKEEKPQTENLN